ncbi:DUF6799 domain-containing protein [Hymenobacter rubripertinctus]|uniref:DUF6799 domain-containing protein n=1 Tax=Hymenobacter rubripertinctus TaxID=2029981 RepID=A0A418R2F3_9BACT|nr:DUF6799 domain-containing protein [Hymenobacter rubripertinctus]RIY11602.1 hypothetical protein D0T11_07270 [Hymenobacter rubripertinctus]
MNIRATLAATFLLVAATALQAEAQTKAPVRRGAQPKPRVTVNAATMKDGYLMKDGKVLETRDAHTGNLSTDATLVNGTKVGADGTVTMADGARIMLKEGDYMSLTGRMTTMAMKMEQDSLRNLQMEKMKGKRRK